MFVAFRKIEQQQGRMYFILVCNQYQSLNNREALLLPFASGSLVHDPSQLQSIRDCTPVSQRNSRVWNRSGQLLSSVILISHNKVPCRTPCFLRRTPVRSRK